MSDSGFLDKNQYTEGGLRDYQKVFGRDFVSPGGVDTARSFLKTFGLPPSALVLDLCCGIGGASFLMAQEFGWTVEGLDLSQNMLKLGQLRCSELKLEQRVRLEYGDCLNMDRPERYDAIYSRDSFLHIANKERLCQILYRSLKPGGQLLFTDYCCGPQPWSKAFENYVDERRYHLATVEEYASHLSQAGFSELEARDCSEEFLQILQRDLEKIEAFGLSGELATSWRGKLQRCRAGEQRWGLFQAVKKGLA